ncbi:MAG: transglycosylase SLT domain-containing protein, partial [Burkholderiales bacterium]|nr:transglycosylase SLT domain-containing protein [Burkholderiales bacterium]
APPPPSAGTSWQAPTPAPTRTTTVIPPPPSANAASSGAATGISAPTIAPSSYYVPPLSKPTAGDIVTVPEHDVATVAADVTQHPDDLDAAPEAPPLQPDNLWIRIRAGFAIPELDSPLVQRHQLWYQNRPEYIGRIVERGRRYLHFVVEEIEKRQMPLEIALLPMIESAYNPVAYSRAHASGIWQFIPATGKQYGLEQNYWYDGRRDVTAATRAALDYLQKLYGDFGDWQLALAAYNWGEGAVARAIEKNLRKGLPTDYSSLSMPTETRNYLPKLQAVKNIVMDPERYGVSLDEIPNQPYFIKVTAPGYIDVHRAAQLAEMPIEEFRSLNPAHNRPIIAGNSGHMLLVPADKAEIFAANLQNLDEPLVSWQAYTLKPKERLDQVAARHGTTVNALRQANGLSPKRPVRAGQLLLVPVHGKAAVREVNFEPTYTTLRHLPPIQDDPDQLFYKVKRGDTVFSIAARYRVSVAQLSHWNKLRKNHITPGQSLTIYPGAARPAANAITPAKKSTKTSQKPAMAKPVKDAAKPKRSSTLKEVQTPGKREKVAHN